MSTFVSYSGKDDAAVRPLVEVLRASGQSVWFDEELRGGQSWWQEILRQIQSADVFVFALSNNALSSQPCISELDYARRLGIPVLPVKIGEVESIRSTPVSDLQVVDYRARDAAAGIALYTAIHQQAATRGALPDPLPAPPPIPFEYLLRLATALDAPRLSSDDQMSMVADLRRALQTEADEGVRADARNLLQRLRRHPDVTVAAATEIDAVVGSGDGPTGGREPGPPAGSRGQPFAQGPGPQYPPARGGQQFPPAAVGQRFPPAEVGPRPAAPKRRGPFIALIVAGVAVVVIGLVLAVALGGGGRGSEVTINGPSVATVGVSTSYRADGVPADATCVWTLTYPNNAQEQNQRCSDVTVTFPGAGEYLLTISYSTPEAGSARSVSLSITAD